MVLDLFSGEGRWLVDELADDGQARDRCADDGAEANRLNCCIITTRAASTRAKTSSGCSPIKESPAAWAGRAIVGTTRRWRASSPRFEVKRGARLPRRQYLEAGASLNRPFAEICRLSQAKLLNERIFLTQLALKSYCPSLRAPLKLKVKSPRAAVGQDNIGFLYRASVQILFRSPLVITLRGQRNMPGSAHVCGNGPLS